MRKHADKFCADPDKIAIWGSSSGAHTAVSVGITGDDTPGETDMYSEYSAAVNCIVDWFGPTAIDRMNADGSVFDHTSPDSPEGRLIGGKTVPENPELAAAVNPINYLAQDKATPPMLIMHGDSDDVVPLNQSVLLYEALKKVGSEVEFYKLTNADHGGQPFWSKEILDIVEEFIRKYI
jgi:acetyl esterase/lipase